MSYKVASVDTALTLLEVIAEHPETGVTEIAQRTGYTKSQVFRLLHTLEMRGYVRKDPAKRTYVLGSKLSYIGEKAKEQTNLIHLAQPYLDELAAACQENVHLVIREGVNSVCADMRQSVHQLRLYAQIGRKGPLHAGGGSKVLLAYSPKAVQEEVFATGLEAYTPATITDAQTLQGVLQRIVKDGYHVAINDLDDGAFSVSAPIRDHSGAVVAALSIAGPTYRLNDEICAFHLKLVLEYSQRISCALGWEPRVSTIA